MLGSRQLWEAEGGGPRIPRRDRKISQGSSEEKREEWGGGAQILLERSRASVRLLSLEGAHLGPEGLRCSGGWGETRRWGRGSISGGFLCPLS